MLKWNYKDHFAFALIYRRQIIYKQISADIGSIIWTLYARKGVKNIEAATMPDHIHFYLAILLRMGSARYCSQRSEPSYSFSP